MADNEVKLEECLMKMEGEMLFLVATKLNIDCPPKTRKFKMISKIVEYVDKELEDNTDQEESIYSHVYEAIDEAHKASGGKEDTDSEVKVVSMATEGRRSGETNDRRSGGPYLQNMWRDQSDGRGGAPDPTRQQPSGGTEHLAALLQNLATQPAATSLYRRMFKVNGSIGGKDGLKFISICSQVHDGKQTGYTEKEIAIGLKKAISSGSTLRSYFDSQPDLSLKKMLDFLRDFYKSKSAAELFSDLSKISQNTDESATIFLLRAFELRAKVAAATAVEDHKFDDNLIYATFCRSVKTGIRGDSIRQHMKKYLDPTKSVVGDEVLLKEINIASSETEETELKQKKPKAAVSAVTFEEDAMTKAMKPLMDNMATLTKQVEELQSRQTRPSSGPNRRYNYQPPRCQACITDKTDKCLHYFKCGSSSHFSRNCRGQQSGNE